VARGCCQWLEADALRRGLEGRTLRGILLFTGREDSPFPAAVVHEDRDLAIHFFEDVDDCIEAYQNYLDYERVRKSQRPDPMFNLYTDDQSDS
jgi:hypothetical protein